MIFIKLRLKVTKFLGRLMYYLAPPRVRSFITDCRHELSMYGRHLIACEQVPRFMNGRETVQLELGGAEPRNGWINVDLYSPADGLSLDLRCPLPFPNCSVDSIYSEHVLEHFRFPHPLFDLLQECYRILKPGGTFSAAVPDIGGAFKAYAQGAKRFYELKYWTNPDPSSYRCPMDELSWLIYMEDHHKFIFDAQNLVMKLQEVGFSDVRLRNFNPDLDRKTRRHQSIYVEASKRIGKELGLQQTRKDSEYHLPTLYPQNNGRVPTDTWEAWMKLLVLCSGHAGSLLDLGCGDGRFLELLSYQEVRKPTDLHGVEINQNLLQEANRLVPGVSLQLWNESSLSYADASFNLVVCRETIESSESPKILITEAWRVLAPQGRLIILTSYPSLVENICIGLPLLHEERIRNGSKALFIFQKSLI